MGTYEGTWDGGRIRQTRRGPRFVIERQVNGKRHRITLEVEGIKAATVQLALFEADPEGYLTKSQAKAKAREEAVRLDAATCKRFREYLEKKGRDSRYIKNVGQYLAWWDERLDGADLRFVKLARYQAVLKENTHGAELHRIAAIKSLCTYLRKEEGLLSVAQDATLSLVVPQAKPAKDKVRRGYPISAVEQLYKHLDDQAVRDVYLLRAKTGMHGSEVNRLASGKGELTAVSITGCEIVGVARFKHKNKGYHLQSLDAQALAAAKRLMARGSAPVDSWCIKTLDEARERAKGQGIELPLVRLGQFRHSFVTWARSAGAHKVTPPGGGGLSLEEVAELVGHRDKRTTHTFYDGTEVPSMAVIPMRLHHDLDPAVLLEHVSNSLPGNASA